MNFSNLHRSHYLQQLTSTNFDVLVIGGGITGCGIALDAALRGLKTALIEKEDFASGTSSRSTKLIHGGLRYLKQLELKLVHDVGTERAVVHRNARHVVIPEKMLLPIVEGGTLGEFSTSVALWVYDVLAGVKKTERRKMLNKSSTLKQEPLLAGDKLLGSGLYFEYRTDDSRLTIEIAKQAYQEGALLLNYLSFEDFIYTNGKITGVKAHDKVTGKNIEIQAKTVVNACGPWVDLLRKKDDSLRGKRLQLTKGVHIVFPYQKLPLKQAVYFDVGDGRMIFAIPRNGITYVGTTDTVYSDSIDKPQCTKADCDYLLKALNTMFPGLGLKLEDIESSWAGLRPLIHEDGKSPSELSRKDEVMVSDTGLISIAGGKLTGYRLMAEKVMDLVVEKSGGKYPSSSTAYKRLGGGNFSSEENFRESRETLLAKAIGQNIPVTVAEVWFQRYGIYMSYVLKNAEQVRNSFAEETEWLLAAELLYAIEHEMVYHPADFFIRRTGDIYFAHPSTKNQLQSATEFLCSKLPVGDLAKQQMLEDITAAYRSAVSFE